MWGVLLVVADGSGWGTMLHHDAPPTGILSSTGLGCLEGGLGRQKHSPTALPPLVPQRPPFLGKADQRGSCSTIPWSSQGWSPGHPHKHPDTRTHTRTRERLRTTDGPPLLGSGEGPIRSAAAAPKLSARPAQVPTRGHCQGGMEEPLSPLDGRHQRVRVPTLKKGHQHHPPCTPLREGQKSFQALQTQRYLPPPPPKSGFPGG